jgi:hypothetical protein
MTMLDERPDPAYTATGSVRSSRRSAALAAAAAGLLLVGAAGFALAASPSSDPSGAPAATADPNASGPPGPPGGHGFGPGFLGKGRGAGMPGGLFGGLFGGPARAFGAIHVTAIDGSNLSLATEDGWTRTISVGSDTTITRAGETIAVGDLAVGDEVRFSETRKTDGSYSIDRLDVVLPTIAGEVTAAGGSTITVKRFDGTTATVHVSGDTTYAARGSTSASLSDVSVGSYVVVQGTARDDGSIDALRVGIGQPTTVEGRLGPGFRFGPRGPNAGNGATPSPGASSSASGA